MRKIFKKALSAVYPVLRSVRIIREVSGLAPQGRLRVLTYHNIPQQYEFEFERHLRWLKKSWQFVDADQFTLMLDGVVPVEQDTLLLTFDDGYLTNRRVAERILEPLNISAIFFVVCNFILLSRQANWQNFVVKMHGLTNIEAVPESVNYINMTMDDLKWLLDAGHTIGAHTATHARLSKIGNPQLESEIIESADLLEKSLQTKIDHFAFTFGDFASLSPEALNVARQRFKYIYTGMRGDNAVGVEPWAIRREANDLMDSLFLTSACLEGGADILYKRKLKLYEGWGSKVTSVPA
jgi:peptidoglycan/xylan/chitin deacetylase (PgdA/CDA1 family)